MSYGSNVSKVNQPIGVYKGDPMFAQMGKIEREREGYGKIAKAMNGDSKFSGMSDEQLQVRLRELEVEKSSLQGSSTKSLFGGRSTNQMDNYEPQQQQKRPLFNGAY